MTTEFSRRSFLKKLLGTLWGIAALSGAYAAATLTPRKRKRLWRLADIPDPHAIAVGEHIWLERANVFVVRDEEGLYGISARCTHLGCTVAKEGARFVCRCHGAVYDEKGARVSGPQPKGLPWLAIERRSDGRYAVDLDAETPPGTKFRI
ncbi:MAG: Rieske (2Fe-2S) protein [Elusimicrobiota bacterium]